MNLSRRELAIAFAVALVAGAALFGANVAGGGFVWDDWSNSANFHFADGLSDVVHRTVTRPVFGYRPVLTTLLTLEHVILGADQQLHVAMAALFGVLTAWALYLLLRTVGLGRRDAAVPAALLLAFPWTDSTRLWAAASFDTLAVTFYLLGLTLAVRALRADGPARAATAGSLALYLAACWTYEIVAGAVLASLAVYVVVAPRRDALRRWGLDVALVVIALLLVATGTTRDPQPLGDQLDHAGTIASQAFSLLTKALLPIGVGIPGVAGAAVVVAVVLAARRHDGARPWLAAAAIGALFVAAGYLLFVPALPHYQPLAPGTTNRMNVLAAVGYVVLVYALVRLVTLRAPRLAPVLCVAIAVGYVVHVAHDERHWTDAHDEQGRILSSLPSTAPPPRTKLYTFNAPTEVAKGIPTFSLPFDLKAAAWLRYDSLTLAAYPIAGSTFIRCERNGLYPTGGSSYGPIHGARYGRAVFIDVPTRRAIPIGSEKACRAWAKRLNAA